MYELAKNLSLLLYYVDVLFKPNSNLVGSVGNCLHELAASGAN